MYPPRSQCSLGSTLLVDARAVVDQHWFDLACLSCPNEWIHVTATVLFM